MSRCTVLSVAADYSDWSAIPPETSISNDRAFDECVILPKSAFDPDAVFLDDIVDETVLPNPDLAVDGLTTVWQGRRGELELRPEDVIADEPRSADSQAPVSVSEPHELEVYGWESGLWRKIRAYIGL